MWKIVINSLKTIFWDLINIHFRFNFRCSQFPIILGPVFTWNPILALLCGLNKNSLYNWHSICPKPLPYPIYRTSTTVYKLHRSILSKEIFELIKNELTKAYRELLVSSQWFHHSTSQSPSLVGYRSPTNLFHCWRRIRLQFVGPVHRSGYGPWSSWNAVWAYRRYRYMSWKRLAFPWQWTRLDNNDIN